MLFLVANLRTLLSSGSCRVRKSVKAYWQNILHVDWITRISSIYIQSGVLKLQNSIHFTNMLAYKGELEKQLLSRNQA